MSFFKKKNERISKNFKSRYGQLKMENQHHNVEAPQHDNMELETERQRVLKEKNINTDNS